MNVVLYTRDMEPITIIDLPMWALEQGERQRIVWVAVMDRLPALSDPSPINIESLKMRTVSLHFHRITLREKRGWMILVDDEETALELTPSWLPGQQRRINDHRRSIRQLATALLDTLARGAGGH